MRTANISLQEFFDEIPREKREETRLSFAISNRLDALMREKGLNKKQFAEAVGKRPNGDYPMVKRGAKFYNRHYCHAVYFFRTADNRGSITILKPILL